MFDEVCYFRTFALDFVIDDRIKIVDDNRHLFFDNLADKLSSFLHVILKLIGKIVRKTFEEVREPWLG